MVMNRTTLASLLGLLVTVSVGCLPYPHAQHDYPEISGKLVGPSGPLEGVKIALLHNPETESCENPDQVVLTTREGKIKFAPKREFQLTMVFGDRLDRWMDGWMLCVEGADGAPLKWSDEGVLGRTKKRVTFMPYRSVAGTSSVPVHRGQEGSPAR
jgi:hypothetical protein